MFFLQDARPTSWRSSPVTRIGGSAAAWFLFSLDVTLLFLVAATVAGLGGSCASGGPYLIETECPASVVLFAPFSILTGLLAIPIAAILAQGFGAQLLGLAWPVLFIGLGILFLAWNDVIGIVLGVLFVAMGAFPLVVEVRGSLQRLLIGRTDAWGRRLRESARAKRSFVAFSRPNPDGAVAPRAADWLLGFGIPAASATAGVSTALAWFATAG